MSLRSFLQRTRLLLEHGIHEARESFRDRPGSSSAPGWVQLEERVMMSASPMLAAAPVESPDSAELTTAAQSADQPVDHDQQLLESVADQTLPPTESTDVQNGVANSTLDESQLLREVIFVDSRIDGLEQILADLQSEAAANPIRNLEIVVLDPDSDGIAQITSTLAGMTQVDGIHIVSHGTDGQVQLGSTLLSIDNYDTYRSAMSSWQHSLSADADILFYGCDLAATEDGQLLMNEISAACNCDIAASDDLTGHADLGGDWVLEYSVGVIQTDSAFGNAAQENWQGVLSTITVTTTADENDGDTSSLTNLEASSGGTGISLREAIIAANNTAGDDTIVLEAGIYNLSLVGSDEDLGATGDLDVLSGITILGDGSGLTIIDGSSLSDRIFDVRSDGSLTLNDLTVSGGDSGSAEGGGVRNQGALSATDVVLSHHSTDVAGGAIFASGMTNLNRVVIHGNTSGGTSGGIEISNGSAALNNVTISGNTSSGDGGGIRVANSTVTLRHSTVANNTSTLGSGGGLRSASGLTNLSNSIFADNVSSSGGSDVDGSILSSGFNIIETNVGLSGATGTDLVGSDAELSALIAVDGTFVHQISTTSVARDAATFSTETVDQVGTLRDANPDIGAYEYVSDYAGGFGPSDLQATATYGGGLEINNDGGNDTYLLADDGSEILGGRDRITFETQFSTTANSGDTILLSYATTSNSNEVLFHLLDDGRLALFINGDNVVVSQSTFDFTDLLDGTPHTLGFTWDGRLGQNGRWEIFLDGQSITSGTGLAADSTIQIGGALLFGQEQDSIEGGFNNTQIFSGTLFQA